MITAIDIMVKYRKKKKKVRTSTLAGLILPFLLAEDQHCELVQHSEENISCCGIPNVLPTSLVSILARFRSLRVPFWSSTSATEIRGSLSCIW